MKDLLLTGLGGLYPVCSSCNNIRHLKLSVTPLSPFMRDDCLLLVFESLKSGLVVHFLHKISEGVLVLDGILYFTGMVFLMNEGLRLLVMESLAHLSRGISVHFNCLIQHALPFIVVLNGLHLGMV